MKKIIISNLILCLIFICGFLIFICLTNSNKNSPTERMLTYINDKYPDDKFVYKSTFGGGAGVNNHKIIVSSKDYPNENIYITYSNDNGVEEITDNYLAVKYADQTKTLIKNILSKVSKGQVFIDYEPSMYACPNKNGTLSFEEYIQNPDSDIGFIIVVNGTVADKQAFSYKFEKALVESKLCCRTGRIFFEDNSNRFNALKKESLSSYIYNKTYSDVFEFEMKDNSNFSVSTWKN